MAINIDPRRFEAVAMGCNARARRVLQDIVEFGEGKTCQFVEYFFNTPLSKKSARRGAASTVRVCLPFLVRVASGAQFRLLASPRGSVSSAVSKKDITELRTLSRISLPYAVLPVAQAVIGKWKSSREPNSWFYEKTFNKQAIRNSLSPLRTLTNSKEKKLFTTSADLLARPWLNCRQKPRCLAYPIASKQVCYGYFFIIVPDPGNSKAGKEVERKIKEEFRRLADEVYRPTLTLLYNSLWEKSVEDDATYRTPTTLQNFIATLPPVEDDRIPDSDQLEGAIAKLWKRRMEFLDQNAMSGDDNSRIQAIKDTLLFAKYNVAAPGTVKLIQEMASRAQVLKVPKAGKSLPTALVYGEPGSGKDTLAKLIPLFTDLNRNQTGGYFGAPSHVINMSALKPDEHVATTLLGNEKSEGLFSLPKSPSVFILDELNSMNQDLQGVLLRVLENGEVTPLTKLEGPKVQHLVIGIVNEDPEIVTRDQEFRDLQKAEEFLGTMFGAYLYDMLHKAKRLRFDLFFRLKRTLYLRLPPLKDRREDIPNLFYVECGNAAKETLGRSVDVDIDYEAFELLMGPSIQWPGNVRQLQALAKEVVTDVLSKNDLSSGPPSINIEQADVRRSRTWRLEIEPATTID